MKNDLGKSLGLHRTFHHWIEEAKITPRELDSNQDGRADQAELSSYVLRHVDKFSPRIQKKIQILKKSFRSLGLTDAEMEAILKDSPEAGAKRLANLGQAQKSWPKAETAYRLAIELAPDFSAGHRGLAEVFYRSGRTKEARRQVEQAVRCAKKHEVIELMNWLLSLKDPLLREQTPVNFVAIQWVKAKRYSDAEQLYAGAVRTAEKLGDPLKRQMYQRKLELVRELGSGKSVRELLSRETSDGVKTSPVMESAPLQASSYEAVEVQLLHHVEGMQAKWGFSGFDLGMLDVKGIRLDPTTSKIVFDSEFFDLEPERRLAALQDLLKVGTRAMWLQASLDPEAGAGANYYAAKVALADGNIPLARLKIMDLKAEVQKFQSADPSYLKNHPETEAMLQELRPLLREFSLLAIGELREANQASQGQRAARVEGKLTSPSWSNGQVLDVLEHFIKTGKADTFEEAAALMRSEQKRLHAEFRQSGTVKAGWNVVLRHPKREDIASLTKTPFLGHSMGEIQKIYAENPQDPRLSDPQYHPEHQIIRLEGGTLDVREVYLDEFNSGVMRVLVGKSGGRVVYRGADRVYSFPPSDQERVVLLYPGESILEVKGLREGPDYRIGTLHQFSGELDGRRLSYLEGHPESLDHAVLHLTHLHGRDADFDRLLKMESRQALEKMSTPEGRKRELLGLAKELRHRTGCYHMTVKIVESLFEEDLARAIAAIPDGEVEEVKRQIEAERPKIRQEAEKSIRGQLKELGKNPKSFRERFPKGEPSASEVEQMVDRTMEGMIEQKVFERLKKKALHRLEAWHEKGELADKFASEAWSTYEDLKDPFDRTWNLADESWDAIGDEVAISVVTMPLTMGVGSLVRGGASRTGLALRLASRGGLSNFAVRAAIFTAGSVAEGLTQELLTAGFFGTDFQWKHVGWNIATSGAFHGGGKAWNKVATRTGLAGNAALNFVGTMATQTAVATTMSYASSWILNDGSAKTFWERLGGEALRMVAYHYGTHAINAATGNAAVEFEFEGQRMLAEAEMAGRQSRRTEPIEPSPATDLDPKAPEPRVIVPDEAGFAPALLGLETSLGTILSEARALFIAHGYPEARISLREVQRTKAYIETFEPSQGLAKATANALWLTLGAGLPQEQRNSEFGLNLKDLISKIELPALERPAFESALAHSVQAKPVDFMPKLGSDQFLLEAAKGDPAFRNFNTDELLKLQVSLADRMEENELSDLIHKIENSSWDYREKTNAFESIGMRAHLSVPQIQELIRAVKRSDPIAENSILGSIGRNSTLGIEAFWELIRAVAGSGGKQNSKAFLLKDIIGTSRLEEARIGALIEATQGLGADINSQVEIYIALAQQKDISGAQLAQLISIIKAFGIDQSGSLNALGVIGKNPNLDQAELRSLIDLLKFFNGTAKTARTLALGEVGSNPLLSAAEVQDIFRAIAESPISPIFKEEALRSIAVSPSLSFVQVDGLIRIFETSHSDPDEKVLAFGRVGRNPNLSDAQFQKILDNIASASMAGSRKIGALKELGADRAFTPVQFQALIETIKGLTGRGVGSQVVTYALGEIGPNPKLSEGQIQELIREIEAMPRGWDPKETALAKICQNPNLSLSKFHSLIRLIASMRLDDPNSSYLKYFFDNKNLSTDKVQLVMENLEDLGGSSSYWLPIVSHPNLSGDAFRRTVEQGRDTDLENYIVSALKLSTESARAYRDEMLERFRGIQVRARELSKLSVDSAARILAEKGDATDLSTNLGILKSKLDGIAVESISVLPSSDFDPSLVSAHQLLDRVAQALAINRFVILSGPPASGKSEVGRYLGQTLGWDTVVFNAHRGTSQEDVMQKIGVVANGTTKFVITDGPLAEALIQGKLFILNEINLAKPGNLAFLFSILADVNQSFDYYNAATGKTERRKIHENFRMIGTQNPEGPGRKDLNAALKNRAIEIDAPAYQDIELVALLRSKHPEFQTEAGMGVPLTLVRFYQDMAMKMASRSIGGEGEGYVWNLRHLMRLAEGFKELGDNPPAFEILQVIYDRVGVSLTPQDREVFFDAVRNYEYKGTKIAPAEVEAFKVSQAKATLQEVYQEFGIDPTQAEKLAQQHGIVNLPTSARFLRSILLSLQAGYHPWLKGPAGTGKTKLASFASELLGAKVYVDTMTPQTDESQLKGELKPTVITLQDGTEKLGFKQVPSSLVEALKDKSKLITCILDEAAFAKPDVLEELNSLLDRDGGIWVVDDHGQAEFLARPEGFRLILASNTYGYSGVSLQSDALRSRTQEIFMGFEFKPEEIAKILATNQTSLSQDYLQSLGTILHDTRALFIAHGYPEARVSLREVQRIKTYIETFESSQGLAKATANALWLTLGASLPQEQRNGELGTELKDLISKAKIPASERLVFESALSQIIQAKPIETDASHSGTAQLWLAAAKDDPIFKDFNGSQATQFQIAVADRLSESAFADLIRHLKKTEINSRSLTYTLEEIAQNPRLNSAHLQGLIVEVKASGADGKSKVEALEDIGKHPNLQAAQFQEVMKAIEESGADPRVRALAFGEIGRNPNLSAAQFQDLMSFIHGFQDPKLEIEALSKFALNSNLSADQAEALRQAVENSKIASSRKASIFGDLGKNPNLSLQQIEKLKRAIEASAANDNYRAYALGEIGRNPKLGSAELQSLIDGIKRLDGDESSKVLVFENVANNPNLNAAQLQDLVESLKGLFADGYTKAAAFGTIGKHPNFDTDQLQKLIETLKNVAIESRYKILAFGEISNNPNLSAAQFQELIQLIEDSQASQEKKALAFRKMIVNPKLSPRQVRELLYKMEDLYPRIGGFAVPSDALVDVVANPNLNPIVYQNVMETIRAVSIDNYIKAIGFETPNNRLHVDEVFIRFKAIQARARELGKVSIDSAARILPEKGDATDLSANLGILKSKLDGTAAEPVAVLPSSDFDPSLVSAHQLLDRVAQALAINRFVILSGPPASGKSEVGRYLGQTLGWDTVVFNAHRGTSQEDVMQKIGVVANGTTKFVITDGPLAEALIQGKLFILNEINLAKPGNLAFLFSILADVNQSFDYYNAATGKTERRKIHENFRMIGTQNPEGPGRKDLNAALKNRAIEIDAPAYQDIELVALLRSKHPEFQTEAGKGVPLTLVRFYQDMAMKMASRSIGAEGEGYVWNLRHLMRLAEGFKELGDNPPAFEILQIIYDRVGVSLTPQDREVFFDAVRNYEYKGTKIIPADVEAFKDSQANVTLQEVYQEFGIDPTQAEKLAQQHGIVDLPTSARFLRSILLSLQAGYHPWLKGPAGTGKTKLASFASELLGAKVYVDTLTPQTDESQLKGELMPTVITLQDGTEKLGFKQVPSALVHALQDKSKLVTCILDEAAFAKPDVLEELNSLLDRDGGIWIVDDHGQAEFLARPEGFRLILASNTYGYSGVSLQSDALRSRTQEIFMGFEFKPEEIAKILATNQTSLSQDYLQSLGTILHDTRALFIAHDYPEARVSLREVQRIKTYIETFESSQGLAKATANALWLTLGASLPQEQRNGELGAKLRSLILKAKMPEQDQLSFESLLSQVIQAKPVEMDATQSGFHQLWVAAVKDDPFFKEFEPSQIVDFQLARAERLGEQAFVDLIGLLSKTWLTVDKIKQIIKSPHLSNHFPEVIAAIESSVPDISYQVYLLGALGLSPSLNREQFHKLCQSIKDSTARGEFKTRAFGEMGKNPSLSPEQFREVGMAIENSGADGTHKALAFGDMGENPKLSAEQFQELVRWIEVSGADSANKVNTYGDMGENPNLGFKQLATLIEVIKKTGGPQSYEAYALGKIGSNPNISSEQIKDLMKAIRRAAASHDSKASAFGDMAKNPNLSSPQLQDLIHAIQNSEAYDDTKAFPFETIGRHPNLSPEQVQQLFTFVQNSVEMSPRGKLRVFAGIGANPRLNAAQLVELIRMVDHSQAPRDLKADVFGKVGANPNRTTAQVREMVRRIRDLYTDPVDDFDYAASNALVDIASNPNLDPVLYREVMEAIRADLTENFVDAVSRARTHSAHRIYTDEIFARFDAIYARAHLLAETSVDSAARILPEKGDATDLSANLGILKSKLDGTAAEPVAVLPSSDFDPNLVSAHQLLDRVAQALAINRFVILSGPPASGKSEVGRYLGQTLGWDTVVFNAHRGTSQEDVMQKIGVVANGTTKFVITDGPLAEALIQGKLFILNEINLAKPGNLAFLFSILADVNQSFDYYNAATGKTERRKIHENFRMIGTQNPEGPGRKDLNAALKNRAIEIDAPAYQDIELVALLRSRHPEFQTEAGKGVPLTLVRFYQDMAMKMASRSIGGEGEGYVWNLRHLMRLAEGFKKLGDNPPASQILQIIYDRVGVSLLPSDREVFFDAVRNYEYRGTKISAADVEAFKSSQAQTNLSAVYKEFGIDPVEAEKLAQQHGIVELATSARFLRSILLSLQAGYHPWLKGPAGTGKTKLASFASELLGAKVYVDTLTPQTDESQLKGELKPTVIILQDGTEKLGFKQVPSALVHALQDKSKLVTCILDEAAFAKPDVLEELNSLLDRDGGIWIIDDHGQAEFLARPEGFRLILASNTYGYSGVSLQSDALRSRTQEIFMGFEFSAEELAAMLLRFSSPGQGRLTTGGAPLGQTRLPLMHSQGFGAWRKSGYRLNTFDNPVRDKLRQGGHQGQIPEATIRLLEERYAELKNRLLGAAASMGRTGEITLEFDLGTATASMTLESPRVFHIGPDFLLTRGIEEMLTVAQHEGGHADISRIGSGYFFSSEKNRALLNVVEDLRVNARAMERAPGRSGEYLRFLKSYYAKSYEEIPQARIPELLPHEAFLQAAMARIYGGQTPWEKDPRVSQALTEALPHIQEAMELRPKDDNPEETKVLEDFARFEKKLKQDILPIYERLYQESLQQVEKALEEEGDSGSGSEGSEGGNSGKSGGSIDPKDLSDKARKMLEDRAKKIADAHAPQGTRGDQQAKAREIYDEGQGSKAKQEGVDRSNKAAKPTSDRLDDFLDGRNQDYRDHQDRIKSQAYSKAMNPWSKTADKIFAVFDKLLKPNSDFEYEGHFTSGPRIEVERAVKAVHGMLTRLAVFQRKVDPASKDYRFSLLLDGSGSMADNSVRQRGGLGLAAVFVDVFERLGLPYSLDAFHDSYIPLKGFRQSLKTVGQRNQFFNNLILNHWGGGGTNLRGGIAGSLKRILAEQKTDRRDIEFLFVLTDGEETNFDGPEIRTLCSQAAKQGIIVVGIGIGEGMQTVRTHFPVHLTETNPERLPGLIMEFIKEYAQSRVEED